MSEISDETRTKALEAIRQFCQKPFSQHGKKRTKGDRKGWYEFHDWGHLVMRLHHLYFGTMLDTPAAAAIAVPLRKEFPNAKDWTARVNRSGVHERIRDIVEQGIASHVPATPLATAP